jgi:hypothetical protein
MAEFPSRCIGGTAPWSGAASLATVSEMQGIPISPAEVAALSQMPGADSRAEGTVLVMARALGYEAVAMEGGYGDLPDVILPLLVALREGEQERYAVLFAVAEEEATVGDPLTGAVSAWKRETFCSLWTGSVVQVTPVEGERQALVDRLVELRDTFGRTVKGLGWGPPYWRRAVLLLAWAGLAAAAAYAPQRSSAGAAWTWIIAIACAGSLWSWLVSDLCALCSYARLLAAGLPVAAAGSLLYAALLATSYLGVPALATGLALGAAVGAHAALVRELAKAKIACWACLFVATCALGAAGIGLGAGEVGLVPVLAAAAITAGALAWLLPTARARQARGWRATAEELAKSVSSEPSPEGTVRLVAFTRKGCPACALFHAAVRPALQATFGEAITIDERDLGRTNVVAPLLVILGARRSLFIGLPPGDPCGAVIEAAKRATETPGEVAEAMTVYGG